MKKKRLFVTCPCCHGEKVLRVWDEPRPDDIEQWPNTEMGYHVDICTHCQGLGKVEAEAEAEAEIVPFE